MITFSCPSCSRPYRVTSDLAGKAARCKTCGEVCRIPDMPQPERPALAASAPVPSQSPEAAPEPRQEGRASGRLAVIFPVGLLVLCGAVYAVVAVFGGRGGPATAGGTSAPVASAKPAPSDDDQFREPVVRWLEELKRGGDGRSHWRALPSVHAVNGIYGNRLQLLSVRSYDILSVEVKPATEFQEDGLKRLAGVVVRVESSDRDGRPIVKTYRVRVGDDGTTTFLLGAV